jgi:Flp pilus assembly protein CpaB
MRTYDFRNLLVPGVLAALAAALTLVYASHHGGTSVASAAGFNGVYVATKDFQAGTAGDDVMKGIRLVRVPATTIVPGAVTSPAELAGRVAVAPLFKGQQLTLRAFAGVRAQGIAGSLSGRMRAIQIAGDANQLLAGTVRSGDHVDVLASLKVGPNQVPHGRTVLRDVLVLKAPSGSPSPGSQTPYSATLALTDAQAQTLFFVAKNGDWSFVLRPVVHAGDSPDFTDSVQSVLSEGR